jgi:hypothetical protein
LRTYLKKILDDVKDWVAKNKKSWIEEYSWNADKQIFEEKPAFQSDESIIRCLGYVEVPDQEKPQVLWMV